jgi:hypothetical protein
MDHNGRYPSIIHHPDVYLESQWVISPRPWVSWSRKRRSSCLSRREGIKPTNLKFRNILGNFLGDIYIYIYSYNSYINKTHISSHITHSLLKKCDISLLTLWRTFPQLGDMPIWYSSCGFNSPSLVASQHACAFHRPNPRTPPRMGVLRPHES